MSYAVDVLPSVLDEILTFDIDIQERVFDEVALLADVADTLPNRPLPIESNHAVDWIGGRGKHTVFLRLVYVPKRRLMQVTQVAHVLRKA